MNVELFCCSGGMAHGFRRAGITFDVAFDADPNACASYERNLGHRPIQMDVRDLAADLALWRAVRDLREWEEVERRAKERRRSGKGGEA